MNSECVLESRDTPTTIPIPSLSIVHVYRLCTFSYMYNYSDFTCFGRLADYKDGYRDVSLLSKTHSVAQ